MTGVLNRGKNVCFKMMKLLMCVGGVLFFFHNEVIFDLSTFNSASSC
jgi:hypothetical protein